MSLERPDATLAEIGDFDDADPGPVAPPRVVIRYRERGIPWLLVPPLIALSGVIAVVGAYSVRKYLRSPVPPSPEVTAAGPSASTPALSSEGEGGPAAPAVAWVDQPPPPTGPTDPFGLPIAEPAPSLPASILAESPVEIPFGDAAAPDEPTPAPVATHDPGETTPPAGRDETVPIGFDPAMLLPEGMGNAQPGAPPDPAVASARLAGDPVASVTGPEVVEPARTEPPQATGVPDALLPPDPRVALVERRRLDAERRLAREEERFRFHADLRALCKEKGNQAAPAIKALIQAYNPVIPAAAKDQANKLLGKTGLYSRVELPQRLALLRRIGFPEPILVNVIFDYETSKVYEMSKFSPSGRTIPIGRDAPSPEVMFVRAAGILLNNPPTRPKTAPGASGSSPTVTVPAAGPARR